MRVVVTGASGFIGRALCGTLKDAVPIGRSDSLALENADAVVHLAAIAHRNASEAELQAVNVELATRVGEAAARARVPMVFMSSIKAAVPDDAYGRSKARAESRLKNIRGLRLTILRPPLVYGPGVKANFLLLMRAIAAGWPLPFRSIANRRSLIYVGNLCDAITRCVESRPAATYFVADGPPVSTPELCRALGAALGRPARLFPFPPALLPKKLAGSLEADDSAIRRELGWQPPASFAQGLRATAAWYVGTRGRSR